MRHFWTWLLVVVASGCQPSDGGTASTEAEELDPGCFEPDGSYPGQCPCVTEGEPCMQGCALNDGALTCNEVCAQVGETCVEKACSGYTTINGTEESCPSASEYGGGYGQACDKPIPAVGYQVECCCTQS